MNSIYQKIELIYNAPEGNFNKYDTTTKITLTNDYSYYNLVEAFIEFSKCIGFELNKKEILKKIKEYVEEEIGENNE